jgi:hypothetical protein
MCEQIEIRSGMRAQGDALIVDWGQQQARYTLFPEEKTKLVHAFGGKTAEEVADLESRLAEWEKKSRDVWSSYFLKRLLDAYGTVGITKLKRGGIGLLISGLTPLEGDDIHDVFERAIHDPQGTISDEKKSPASIILALKDKVTLADPDKAIVPVELFKAAVEMAKEANQNA